MTLRDKLRRNHPERRQILLGMTEHRQDPMEIHDLPVLLPDRQQFLDRRHGIRKDRQQQLGHRILQQDRRGAGQKPVLSASISIFAISDTPPRHKPAAPALSAALSL
jgi:hypothetical protein